jgi:hypothetical protein
VTLNCTFFKVGWDKIITRETEGNARCRLHRKSPKVFRKNLPLDSLEQRVRLSGQIYLFGCNAVPKTFHLSFKDDFDVLWLEETGEFHVFWPTPEELKERYWFK